MVFAHIHYNRYFEFGRVLCIDFFLPSHKNIHPFSLSNFWGAYHSNDFLFAAKKLTDLSANKFLELCHQDKTIRDKSFLATDINVFVEGILCEYVKYCRGYSAIGLNELYLYTKDWLKRFRERRCFAPGLV